MAKRSGKNENATRPVLDSRRKVMSALINAFPGGRECAAARLGLELKKFDNQAYESVGHRPLTDDQIYLLEQTAGTTFLPDYICRMYGGVFVATPDAEELDNLDLYALGLRTQVRRGEVDKIIAKALEDGHIDEADMAEIIAAHREHIAARHEEVGAVITLHRKQHQQ